MKRLPPIRRKNDYISQIDAARKRQRFGKEPCEEDMIGYSDETAELEICETAANEAPVYMESGASLSGRLNCRKYRMVRRSELLHDTSHYQRNYPLVSSSPFATTSSAECRGHYYVNDMNEDVPHQRSSSRQLPVEALYSSHDYHQEYEVVPEKSSEEVATTSAASSSRLPVGKQVWFANKDSSPHVNDIVDGREDCELRSTETKDTFTKEELGRVEKFEVIPHTIDGYDYADVDYREDIQEQIEVVDEAPDMPSTASFHTEENVYQSSFPTSTNQPIDMHKLFESMSRHKSQSNAQLVSYFLADPAMSYPLDVNALVEAARTATVEENAQSIASLAMQVNYFKRDLLKVRQDVTDLRSAFYLKENVSYTARKFMPTAETSLPWRIAAAPPLMEVDLVQVARELNISRPGKKVMKNKDAISRFVREALKKLVPQEVVKRYTVKDRQQNGAFDIGTHAKDQITGIVLDLLGLHNADKLDHRSRADRAHYAQLVNECMKHAMYDMRRTSPKRKVHI